MRFYLEVLASYVNTKNMSFNSDYTYYQRLRIYIIIIKFVCSKSTTDRLKVNKNKEYLALEQDYTSLINNIQL